MSDAAQIRAEIQRLRENMNKEILGQEDIVEKLIIGLLGNGHLLVEGLPGLAKTRAIKAMVNNIEGSYGRIQFTPDLVSSDITGKEIMQKDEQTGDAAFKFAPGPVFNNVVLADEINRAPSKTQNALLEAMEERQVTVAAVPHKMPDLFMVMATQNPSTQEGTFPLPEAQMDRFIMHLTVDYPDEATEGRIIRLVREEQSQETKTVQTGKKPEKKRISQDAIFAARSHVDKVAVPPHVEKYIVDLIFATRYPARYTYELKSYISLGASPRGTLAMDRCTRVVAWLAGRDYATIEDVQSVIKGVLRHRIAITDRGREHNVLTDELIDDILELVSVPEEGESLNPEETQEKQAAQAAENADAAAGSQVQVAPDAPPAQVQDKDKVQGQETQAENTRAQDTQAQGDDAPHAAAPPEHPQRPPQPPQPPTPPPEPPQEPPAPPSTPDVPPAPPETPPTPPQEAPPVEPPQEMPPPSEPSIPEAPPREMPPPQEQVQNQTQGQVVQETQDSQDQIQTASSQSGQQSAS
jgi:MoxR-like ATPase